MTDNAENQSIPPDSTHIPSPSADGTASAPGNPLGFDPVRGLLNLRDSVNRIVEDGLTVVGGGLAVTLDIYETDLAVIVKTSPLLGVQPETIDVSITGGVLTIRGETRPEEIIPADRYIRRERKYGPFVRTVTIPRAVRPDRAAADFKDTVLTITLPKADEARAHTINVGTARTSTSTAREE